MWAAEDECGCRQPVSRVHVDGDDDGGETIQPRLVDATTSHPARLGQECSGRHHGDRTGGEGRNSHRQHGQVPRRFTVQNEETWAADRSMYLILASRHRLQKCT